MKEITKYTNDFFTYCDRVGIVLTDDGIAMRENLCYWQNDENINQEIVDNVLSYLDKNTSLNLNLNDLYNWYHNFERPIPDEAEFRKFWNLNKREYNRIMKFFSDKDIKYKKAEIDERMKKMNSDF